jgi:hypothetical protein
MAQINWCSLSMALLLVTTILLSCVNYAGAIQKSDATAMPKLDSKMLQFKAGDHILGFEPTKAYLASMDHALSVEFLGTQGVTPKADNNVSSNERGKAQPLGKVTYQNLWPGISLWWLCRICVKDVANHMPQ